jgi:hypothetical protein
MIIMPSASRALVISLVRTRVRTTVFSSQHVIHIQTTWQRHATLNLMWHNRMFQIRSFSTGRIDSWFPNWLTQFPRAAQPVTQAPSTPASPSGGSDSGSGGSPDPHAELKRTVPGHIPIARLREMMADHRDFLVHGTNDESVGTLRSALTGDVAQGRRVNPTAPAGVYAWEGFLTVFSVGYRPFGVVMRKGGGFREFERGTGVYILDGTGQVPLELIEGWITEYDIEEARRSQ